MKRVGAGLLMLTAAALAGCACRPTQEAGAAPAPRYAAMTVESFQRGEASSEMERLFRLLGERFAAELNSGSLKLVSLPDDTVVLEFSGDAVFDADSAQLRAASLQFYSRLAAVVLRDNRTVLHVVVQADASEDATLSLGERRAASAAAYIEELGVPGTRLRHEARSLREPSARDTSASAQRLNRGLDLVIRPVIEGQEERAWMPPSYPGG